MISKFVNWSSTLGKANKISSMLSNPVGDTTWWDYYLNVLNENKVNYSAGTASYTADPYYTFLKIKGYQRAFQDDPASGGTITNLTNLLNPSLTKTITCPVITDSSGTGKKVSGVSIGFKSNAANNKRFFNSIVIQLNKIDKNYIDSVRGHTFVFEYLRKPTDGNSTSATNSVGFRIEWFPDYPALPNAVNYSEVNGSSTTICTGLRLRMPATNLEEGLFFIDQELIKAMSPTVDKFTVAGVNGVEYATHFNFFMIAPDNTNTTPLKISNIVLGNYLGVYPDDKIKIGVKNLTNFNLSKKTGVAFPIAGESQKTIDGSFSLLHLSETLPMLHFGKTNKETPFYFFPFSEPSKDFATVAAALADVNTFRLNGMNIAGGGLFTFDPQYDINITDTTDYIALPLKLDEYK